MLKIAEIVNTPAALLRCRFEAVSHNSFFQSRYAPWRAQVLVYSKATQKAANHKLQGGKVVRPVFVASLFLTGATLGPLLDGIHGTAHLLTYKAAPFDIGGLHSSFWVPPLLGSFYVVIGSLHTVLDSIATGTNVPKQLTDLQDFLASPGNRSATAQLQRQISLPYAAASTAVVAGLLYLSAVLYSAEVPYPQIALVLAVGAASNWAIFDGTRQGALLAALCAVAAPASELVFINVLHLWQYPRPDVFGPGGVPSWVALCYFFYTPAVGNLARWLWTRN